MKLSTILAKLTKEEQKKVINIIKAAGELKLWTKVTPAVTKKAFIINVSSVSLNTAKQLQLYFKVDEPFFDKLEELMDAKSNWHVAIELRLGGTIHKMEGVFIGYRDFIVVKKIDKKTYKEIIDLAGL